MSPCHPFQHRKSRISRVPTPARIIPTSPPPPAPLVSRFSHAEGPQARLGRAPAASRRLAGHPQHTVLGSLYGVRFRGPRVCGALRTRPLGWFMDGLRRMLLQRSGCCLAVLLLACLVGPATRSANASCGDWLAGHPVPSAAERQPVGRPVLTREAALFDAGATEAFRDLAGQPALRAPAGQPARPRCNGPACSRRPDLPLTPTTAPADLLSTTSRMQACMPHEHPAAAARIAWLWPEDSLLLSDEPTSRIERPPMHG